MDKIYFITTRLTIIKTSTNYFIFFIMKKILFITLMISTLLGLIGCQSLWYQFLNVIVDVAPDRFVFEEDHEKLSTPIITSQPLGKNNDETELNNEYSHISCFFLSQFSPEDPSKSTLEAKQAARLWLLNIPVSIIMLSTGETARNSYLSAIN